MELVMVGSLRRIALPCEHSKFCNNGSKLPPGNRFHDYKAVRPREDIYSVKTGLWRRLKNPPAPHYQAFDSKQRSVFLHGAVHWIVTSEAVFEKCLSAVCLDSSPHSTSGSIWMMKEQVTLLGRQFKFTLAASS
ncbi:hypothetical protein Peur_028454 [Populus x canadensis]